MIDHIPMWINILFITVTIITVGLCYLSNGKSKKLLLLITSWAIVQSNVAYSGFYLNVDAMPPRFLFVMVPVVLVIIYSLRPKQIEWMRKHRNTTISTFLHTIRIPAEIVLLYLFIHGMIPELMTFEGRNFDILAGLTAPIIGWLIMKKKVSIKGQLIWNITGLFLILFILINGTLSAELPVQMFGFEQPNRAVFYFPFILLPSVVVPIVVYTHITDIIKLRTELLTTKSIQHDA